MLTWSYHSNYIHTKCILFKLIDLDYVEMHINIQSMRHDAGFMFFNGNMMILLVTVDNSMTVTLHSERYCTTQEQVENVC